MSVQINQNEHNNFKKASLPSCGLAFQQFIFSFIQAQRRKFESTIKANKELNHFERIMFKTHFIKRPSSNSKDGTEMNLIFTIRIQITHHFHKSWLIFTGFVQLCEKKQVIVVDIYGDLLSDSSIRSSTNFRNLPLWT